MSKIYCLVQRTHQRAKPKKLDIIGALMSNEAVYFAWKKRNIVREGRYYAILMKYPIVVQRSDYPKLWELHRIGEEQFKEA